MNKTAKPTTAKWLTLEEKIEKIIKEMKPQGDIKDTVASLKKLFLQTLHPEQFCPKCENQMFLQDGVYSCINCGYKPEDTKTKKTVSTTPSKKGSIPSEVDNLIKNSKRGLPTDNRGKKIRELASQVDSGNVVPTQDDANRIKNIDPNVKDINWC